MTAKGITSLEFGSFREFVELYSGRISEEGMYVESDDPAPVGSTVEFEVSLSDNFRLLHGTGEVLWTVDAPGKGEMPAGMAIRFKDTDEPSRRLIARLVDNHRRAGGEVFSLAPSGAEAAGAAPRGPEPAPAGDLLESAQDLWRHRAPAAAGPLDGPLGDLGGAAGGGLAAGAPLEVMEDLGVPAEPEYQAAAELFDEGPRKRVAPLFPGPASAGEAAEVAAPEEPEEEAPSAEEEARDLEWEPPADEPEEASASAQEEAVPAAEPDEYFFEPPPLGFPPLDGEAEPPPAEPPATMGPVAEGSMEFWMSSEPFAADPEASDAAEPATPEPAAPLPSDFEPAEPRRPVKPLRELPVIEPPRAEPIAAAPPAPADPGPAAPTPAPLAPPTPAPSVPAAVVVPPAPPTEPAEEPGSEDEAGTAVVPPLAGAGQVKPAGRPRVVVLAALLLIVAALGIVYLQRDRLRSLMGDAGAGEPASVSEPPVAAPPPAVAPAPPAVEPVAAPADGEAPAAGAPAAAPQPKASVDDPASAAAPGEAALPRAPEPAPPTAAPSPETAVPVVEGDAAPPLPEPAAGEAPPLPPATRLEDIRWQSADGETVLTLEFDGAVRSGDYEIMRVESPPPREVVRVFGLAPFGRPRFEVGTPEVRAVRTGFHDLASGAELHVVIDLADEELQVSGVQTGFRGLRIRISRGR